MNNVRIYGSNALKLTDENYIINNKYKRIKPRKKHKWKLKESYKNFYIAVGNVLGLLGIILCIVLFTFGVGIFL